MTRVDFYILDSAEPEDALRYACRLTEKAYKNGHQLCLQTSDANQSNVLDTLLWGHRPESFIPHSQSDNDESVLIQHNGEVGAHHDVMVNLGREVPAAFSRFKRLAEIVCQEPSLLTASRERYAFYQQRGYPLHTHRIKV
ncbi:DNA polymerase III, chi subunit [Spongiibacter sp. IMCC21906]|jgi:DNA polymerase-3 subunit chi|uniref:DNA polymerase III subunit chi n=1 Tax=Spongiibacter sp. IMCC21906 TaxID=1620392 RepID=UPI00062DFEFF|nr:DNA polymerase III subunit chi [Spongiibacter sp. IMCC21906]AKH70164.1 DNA polymerase III, chi subunit [Spongiibacter sp. IMCC21906]